MVSCTFQIFVFNSILTYSLLTINFSLLVIFLLSKRVGARRSVLNNYVHDFIIVSQF